MKVVIYANMALGGMHGGVEHFTVSLIQALGKLSDGDEKYIVISHPDYTGLLNKIIGPGQSVITESLSKSESATGIRQIIPPFMVPPLRVARNMFLFIKGTTYYRQIPKSTGFFESLGVDVVHFPFPHYIPSSLPTIYCPHDLQHIYYPDFFSRESLTYRRNSYPAHCHWAQAVAVDLQWVKEDIIRNYHVSAEKIYVIPFASPTILYEQVSVALLKNVGQKYGLPETFIFYPARTWAHKNHLRLLEAIARLRDNQQLTVNLICTGGKDDFWPRIEQRINELNLNEQVKFLGYVESLELKALYKLAQFVIFPTLFEGGGLPLYEAFQEGSTVACSDIPALRGLAGDATLLFDPMSVDDIARALRTMSMDRELRDTLRRRGQERSRLFTWEKTAKSYRALYRKLAGNVLSQEDRHLLENPEKV